MASITVKKLIDTVIDILQDLDYDQWSLDQLITNYNLATKEIISMNDSANAVEESIKLASGSKQSMPAYAFKALDIICNMGTDGETEGDTISQADLMSIKAFDRSWRTADADNVIINWISDPNDKKTFYVYPPSDGTTYVLARFPKIPDDIVYDDEGDWENALVGIIDDFVLTLQEKIIELSYKKDSDIPGNKVREDDANKEFMSGLAARAT